MPAIAYLSQGQLFLLDGAGTPLEVVSQFAQDYDNRRERQREVDGWKERSGIWGNMGFAPPDISQWPQGEKRLTCRFLGLDRGPTTGNLAYVLGFGHQHQRSLHV